MRNIERMAPQDVMASVADYLTAGIAYHLDNDEPEIAAPLQSYAAAAWAGATDVASLDDVIKKGEEALACFRSMPGARLARTAVLSTLDDLTRHRDRAHPKSGTLPSPTPYVDDAGQLFPTTSPTPPARDNSIKDLLSGLRLRRGAVLRRPPLAHMGELRLLLKSGADVVVLNGSDLWRLVGHQRHDDTTDNLLMRELEQIDARITPDALPQHESDTVAITLKSAHIRHARH
jgi:hypothetical protein